METSEDISYRDSIISNGASLNLQLFRQQENNLFTELLFEVINDDFVLELAAYNNNISKINSNNNQLESICNSIDIDILSRNIKSSESYELPNLNILNDNYPATSNTFFLYEMRQIIINSIRSNKLTIPINEMDEKTNNQLSIQYKQRQSKMKQPPSVLLQWTFASMFPLIETMQTINPLLKKQTIDMLLSILQNAPALSLINEAAISTTHMVEFLKDEPEALLGIALHNGSLHSILKHIEPLINEEKIAWNIKPYIKQLDIYAGNQSTLQLINDNNYITSIRHQCTYHSVLDQLSNENITREKFDKVALASMCSDGKSLYVNTYSCAFKMGAGFDRVQDVQHIKIRNSMKYPQLLYINQRYFSVSFRQQHQICVLDELDCNDLNQSCNEIVIYEPTDMKEAIRIFANDTHVFCFYVNREDKEEVMKSNNNDEHINSNKTNSHYNNNNNNNNHKQNDSKNNNFSNDNNDNNNNDSNNKNKNNFWIRYYVDIFKLEGTDQLVYCRTILLPLGYTQFPHNLGPDRKVPLHNFYVGMKIDARDTIGKWYVATVVKVTPARIMVSFDGWSSRWDEWLPADSPRIAQLGEHSKMAVGSQKVTSEITTINWTSKKILDPNINEVLFNCDCHNYNDSTRYITIHEKFDPLSSTFIAVVIDELEDIYQSNGEIRHIRLKVAGHNDYLICMNKFAMYNERTNEWYRLIRKATESPQQIRCILFDVMWYATSSELVCVCPPYCSPNTSSTDTLCRAFSIKDGSFLGQTYLKNFKMNAITYDSDNSAVWAYDTLHQCVYRWHHISLQSIEYHEDVVEKQNESSISNLLLVLSKVGGPTFIDSHPETFQIITRLLKHYSQMPHSKPTSIAIKSLLKLVLINISVNNKIDENIKELREVITHLAVEYPFAKDILWLGYESFFAKADDIADFIIEYNKTGLNELPSYLLAIIHKLICEKESTKRVLMHLLDRCSSLEFKDESTIWIATHPAVVLLTHIQQITKTSQPQIFCEYGLNALIKMNELITSQNDIGINRCNAFIHTIIPLLLVLGDEFIDEWEEELIKLLSNLDRITLSNNNKCNNDSIDDENINMDDDDADEYIKYNHESMLPCKIVTRKIESGKIMRTNMYSRNILIKGAVGLLISFNGVQANQSKSTLTVDTVRKKWIFGPDNSPFPTSFLKVQGNKINFTWSADSSKSNDSHSLSCTVYGFVPTTNQSLSWAVDMQLSVAYMLRKCLKWKNLSDFPQLEYDKKYEQEFPFNAFYDHSHGENVTLMNSNVEINVYKVLKRFRAITSDRQAFIPVKQFSRRVKRLGQIHTEYQVFISDLSRNITLDEVIVEIDKLEPDKLQEYLMYTLVERNQLAQRILNDRSSYKPMSRATYMKCLADRLNNLASYCLSLNMTSPWSIDKVINLFKLFCHVSDEMPTTTIKRLCQMRTQLCKARIQNIRKLVKCIKASRSLLVREIIIDEIFPFQLVNDIIGCSLLSYDDIIDEIDELFLVCIDSIKQFIKNVKTTSYQIISFTNYIARLMYILHQKPSASKIDILPAFYMIFQYYYTLPKYPVDNNFQPLIKNNSCSFGSTGEINAEIDIYECRTCGLIQGQCCCRACALSCHDGHDCTYRGKFRGYCDCGLTSTCNCIDQLKIDMIEKSIKYLFEYCSILLWRLSIKNRVSLVAVQKCVDQEINNLKMIMNNKIKFDEELFINLANAKYSFQHETILYTLMRCLYGVVVNFDFDFQESYEIKAVNEISNSLLSLITDGYVISSRLYSIVVNILRQLLPFLDEYSSIWMEKIVYCVGKTLLLNHSPKFNQVKETDSLHQDTSKKYDHDTKNKTMHENKTYNNMNIDDDDTKELIDNDTKDNENSIVVYENNDDNKDENNDDENKDKNNDDENKDKYNDDDKDDNNDNNKDVNDDNNKDVNDDNNKDENDSSDCYDYFSDHFIQDDVRNCINDEVDDLVYNLRERFNYFVDFKGKDPKSIMEETTHCVVLNMSKSEVEKKFDKFWSHYERIIVKDRKKRDEKLKAADIKKDIQNDLKKNNESILIRGNFEQCRSLAVSIAEQNLRSSISLPKGERIKMNNNLEHYNQQRSKLSWTAQSCLTVAATLIDLLCDTMESSSQSSTMLNKLLDWIKQIKPCMTVPGSSRWGSIENYMPWLLNEVNKKASKELFIGIGALCIFNGQNLCNYPFLSLPIWTKSKRITRRGIVIEEPHMLEDDIKVVYDESNIITTLPLQDITYKDDLRIYDLMHDIDVTKLFSILLSTSLMLNAGYYLSSENIHKNHSSESNWAVAFIKRKVMQSLFRLIQTNSRILLIEILSRPDALRMIRKVAIPPIKSLSSINIDIIWLMMFQQMRNMEYKGGKFFEVYGRTFLSSGQEYWNPKLRNKLLKQLLLYFPFPITTELPTKIANKTPNGIVAVNTLKSQHIYGASNREHGDGCRSYFRPLVLLGNRTIPKACYEYYFEVTIVKLYQRDYFQLQYYNSVSIGLCPNINVASSGTFHGWSEGSVYFDTIAQRAAYYSVYGEVKMPDLDVHNLCDLKLDEDSWAVAYVVEKANGKYNVVDIGTESQHAQRRLDFDSTDLASLGTHTNKRFAQPIYNSNDVPFDRKLPQNNDVIGCYWNQKTGVVRFTYNGKLSPSKLSRKIKGYMFPAVSCAGLDSAVRVNFGQDPFMFDVKSHINILRDIEMDIPDLETPVESMPSIAALMRSFRDENLLEPTFEEVDEILNSSSTSVPDIRSLSVASSVASSSSSSSFLSRSNNIHSSNRHNRRQNSSMFLSERDSDWNLESSYDFEHNLEQMPRPSSNISRSGLPFDDFQTVISQLESELNLNNMRILELPANSRMPLPQGFPSGVVPRAVLLLAGLLNSDESSSSSSSSNNRNGPISAILVSHSDRRPKITNTSLKSITDINLGAPVRIIPKAKKVILSTFDISNGESPFPNIKYDMSGEYGYVIDIDIESEAVLVEHLSGGNTKLLRYWWPYVALERVNTTNLAQSLLILDPLIIKNFSLLVEHTSFAIQAQNIMLLLSSKIMPVFTRWTIQNRNKITPLLVTEILQIACKRAYNRWSPTDQINKNLQLNDNIPDFPETLTAFVVNKPSALSDIIKECINMFKDETKKLKYICTLTELPKNNNRILWTNNISANNTICWWIYFSNQCKLPNGAQLNIYTNDACINPIATLTRESNFQPLQVHSCNLYFECKYDHNIKASDLGGTHIELFCSPISVHLPLAFDMLERLVSAYNTQRSMVVLMNLCDDDYQSTIVTNDIVRMAFEAGMSLIYCNHAPINVRCRTLLLLGNLLEIAPYGVFDDLSIVRPLYRTMCSQYSKEMGTNADELFDVKKLKIPSILLQRTLSFMISLRIHLSYKLDKYCGKDLRFQSNNTSDSDSEPTLLVNELNEGFLDDAALIKLVNETDIIESPSIMYEYAMFDLEMAELDIIAHPAVTTIRYFPKFSSKAELENFEEFLGTSSAKFFDRVYDCMQDLRSIISKCNQKYRWIQLDTINDLQLQLFEPEELIPVRESQWNLPALEQVIKYLINLVSVVPNKNSPVEISNYEMTETPYYKEDEDCSIIRTRPFYEVRHEAATLQELNRRLATILPLLDLNQTSIRTGNMTHLLFLCRSLILPTYKNSFVNVVLKATAANKSEHSHRSMHELPHMILDRVAASECYGNKNALFEDTIFGQSFTQLKNVPRSEFRVAPADGNNSIVAFSVTFKNESVLGLPGPFREYFNDICRELQAIGKDSLPIDLLVPTPNNESSIGAGRDNFIINAQSTNLEHFRFFGLLLGISFRTNILLGINLPSIFWKQLCNETITLKDFENLDVGFVRTLNRIIDSEAEVELSKELDVVGEYLPDLWPSSFNRDVCVANKTKIAVHIATQYLLRISAQMQAVRSGFGEIVPLPILAIFTWEALEEKLCGAQIIDIKMLQRHTVYTGGVQKHDDHIIFFWNVFASFTNKQRQRFISFAYGQQRLPATDEQFDSYPQVRMSIKPHSSKSDDQDHLLPRADTCFFNVEIPRYSSLEITRERLLFIVNSDADWGMSGDGGNSSLSSSSSSSSRPPPPSINLPLRPRSQRAMHSQRRPLRRSYAMRPDDPSVIPSSSPSSRR